jgi:hypothetical protein
MIPLSAAQLAGLITVRSGPLPVPQSTLNIVNTILDLVGSNAPNTTSITDIYRSLDTQAVLNAQIDVVGILAEMVTYKLILYCEMLGVYYIPINGSRPIASAFVLI